MARRCIQTVNQVLRLEIGYNNGDIGPASLMDAIEEALKKGEVLDEAGVVYIRGDMPAENFIAVDIWAPDPENAVEPPPTPSPLTKEEVDGLYRTAS